MAELLREHRAQSDAHVRNVEEVFGLMGWEVDDSACPAIDGLQAEAKANAKKTDNAIRRWARPGTRMTAWPR